jgi:hypothetical protein
MDPCGSGSSASERDKTLRGSIGPGRYAIQLYCMKYTMPFSYPNTVFLYIYSIYTPKYTYTPIFLYTFTPIHLHTYIPIHLYTYTPIHLYTYTPIHLYTYAQCGNKPQLCSLIADAADAVRLISKELTWKVHFEVSQVGVICQYVICTL